MEVHDNAIVRSQRTVVQMLRDAFRVRGETIRELPVIATEHQVERTSCTVAAVRLPPWMSGGLRRGRSHPCDCHQHSSPRAGFV
jgi:hypothetical protein